MPEGQGLLLALKLAILARYPLLDRLVPGSKVNNSASLPPEVLEADMFPFDDNYSSKSSHN